MIIERGFSSCGAGQRDAAGRVAGGHLAVDLLLFDFTGTGQRGLALAPRLLLLADRVPLASEGAQLVDVAVGGRSFEGLLMRGVLDVSLVVQVGDPADLAEISSWIHLEQILGRGWLTALEV